MTQARCAECRYWPLHPGYQPKYAGAEPNGLYGYQMDGSVSDCRKGPPRSDPQRTNFGGDAVWPTTKRDDWCGEFEHRVTGEKSA